MSLRATRIRPIVLIAVVALVVAGWMWMGGSAADRLAGPLGGHVPPGQAALAPTSASCPEKLLAPFRAAVTRALGAPGPAPSATVSFECAENRIRAVMRDRAGTVLAEATAPFVEAAPAGRSIVLVTSQPPNAEIAIDGKPAGVTPAALVLSPGRHTVHLAEPAHWPAHEEINLAKGVNPQRDYVLAAATGRIAVVTEPAGARLAIDGRPLADVSPALAGPLPAGRHAIAASWTGRATVNAEVTVEAGRTAQVALSAPGAVPAAPATWREPVTGMEFVRVPGGCYTMGCGPWTSDCDPDEKLVHDVCIDSFWMARTEVTRAQWHKVMGSLPPMNGAPDDRPVNRVSWTMAKRFVERLNALAGGRFDLPTEAEWEYACRSGGRPEKFPGGIEAGERAAGSDYSQQFAWLGEGWDAGPFPVATKKPNGLGLYDMAGNVWEWNADSFSDHAYVQHAPKNPRYEDGGPVRSIRGGSWFNHNRLGRCSHRYRFEADFDGGDVGLRVARHDR